jgi:hypothetical protein
MQCCVWDEKGGMVLNVGVVLRSAAMFVTNRRIAMSRTTSRRRISIPTKEALHYQVV